MCTLRPYPALIACVLYVLSAFPSDLAGQPTVHPFGLEVATDQQLASISAGTHVKLWVATGDRAFIDLLPASAVTVFADDAGTDFIAEHNAIQEAWREETERLAQQGTVRFSSRMERPLLRGGSPADDTSGFVVRIGSLAAPASDSEALHLAGTLVYEASSTDTTLLTIEVADLRRAADQGEPIAFDGGTLTLRRDGSSTSYPFFDADPADGGRYYGYTAALEGATAVAFSLDGDQFRPALMLSDAAASGPLQLYIRAVPVETRSLDFDVTFGLGLEPR